MVSEDLQKEIERLKQENEKLKADKKKAKDIYFKVSQKGAVSAYGLGRFPVTLYQEQWIKLLDRKEQILEFIEENASELKTKE
ncbi:MAG: hypothetical protein CME71_09320 [Halobacteriovorax sp.]|nr:hypothetical protein [Halobacteriovorax sp.]